MKRIELSAPAKINISLDVLNKRSDGYHELKMIMQTVDVCDTVHIEEYEKPNIVIECQDRQIPCGRENTVYRAAELLMKKYGIDSGLKIVIDKKIPVAAGLAGGSADAAAVIKGMNSMFSLNMTPEQMREAGKVIGADVPYCIEGGTMLAEGIGERLTRLPAFSNVDIVLLKPAVSVSTAWVYKNLKLENIAARPDTERLIEAVSEKDIAFVAENMVNVLESVTIPAYPEVQKAKEELVRLGAAGSLMSGSGPSVFGIFEDPDKAEYAARVLAGREWQCFLAKTI